MNLVHLLNLYIAKMGVYKGLFLGRCYKKRGYLKNEYPLLRMIGGYYEG